MKTREQWYRENYTSGEWQNWWNITLDQIAAIQHDAQRAAYTQCAEIIRQVLPAERLDWANSHYGMDDAIQIIETARDALKLP